MTVAAIVCFAVAAGLGVLLMRYVLFRKHTPKGVALTHGLVAGLGLALLAAAWASGRPGVALPFALFLGAAAGGAFLAYRDIVHGSVPKSVAVAHALVAVTAFAALLYSLAR